MKRLKRWNAARDALLWAEAPTCIDTRGMMVRLNEMEGPPIPTLKAVRERIKALGIQRSEELKQQICSAAGMRGNKSMRRSKGARTPERVRLLEAEYPHSTDTAALLAKMNALPGPVMRTEQAVRSMAKALFIKKTPEALHASRVRSGQGNIKHAHAKLGLAPDLRKQPWLRESGTAGAVVARQQARPRVHSSGTGIVDATDFTVPRRAFVSPARPYDPAQDPGPERADAVAAARYARQIEAVERAMQKHKGDVPWETTVMIATQHKIPPARVRMLIGQVRLRGGEARL